MKYKIIHIMTFAAFTLGLLTSTGPLHAKESYPDFSRDYWVQQQDAARAKMIRGAGLGVVGLASIWPTSLMISKAVDNPQKYTALSVVFGLMSLGAMGHGFGSVGFGKKQKDAATDFVDAYDANAATVDVVSEQEEYLNGAKKTRRKTMIFGAYLSTVASVLLTNGIVQSVRKHRGADTDDIEIWPYFLTGGLLLPLGVAIMIKSKRTLDELDALENTAVSTQTTSVAPFYSQDNTGAPFFGLAFSSGF